MAFVKFKNGQFVVGKQFSPVYLIEMDDTYLTISGHGTFDKVIGYRRYQSVLIDWFYDAFMCVQEFSVSDAILYVNSNGWDDDAGKGMTVSPTAIPASFAANAPWLIDELPMIEIHIEKATRCDCGGVKCKLPCVDWCSLRKKSNY